MKYLADYQLQALSKYLRKLNNDEELPDGLIKVFKKVEDERHSRRTKAYLDRDTEYNLLIKEGLESLVEKLAALGEVEL